MLKPKLTRSSRKILKAMDAQQDKILTITAIRQAAGLTIRGCAQLLHRMWRDKLIDHSRVGSQLAYQITFGGMQALVRDKGETK